MQEWQEWTVPALAGLLALLAAALLMLLVRQRAHVARELRAAYAEATALREQVEQIQQRLAAPPPATGLPTRSATEYVITDLGAGEPEASISPARVDRALFADLVVRETVVKAASLTHGVRRALTPETRSRIRFEIRRQTRAARKQRRRALRDLSRRPRSGDTASDAA